MSQGIRGKELEIHTRTYTITALRIIDFYFYFLYLYCVLSSFPFSNQLPSITSLIALQPLAGMTCGKIPLRPMLMWFSELLRSNDKVLLMKSLKHNTSRIMASGKVVQGSRNDLKFVSLFVSKKTDPMSLLLFFISRSTQLIKFQLYYMFTQYILRSLVLSNLYYLCSTIKKKMNPMLLYV